MYAAIPASAAALLDLIGQTEAPKGYDSIFGNNQDKLSKPISSMDLNEIISSGPSWTRSFGSSACGRYQFMTATLKSLKASEGLSGLEQFIPDLQDRLAYALLDRRGYEQFVAGRMSITDFGLALAKEWASFPVLAECQGAHRVVKRGETYYAGDRLNRALISPEAVESILSLHSKGLAEVSGSDVFAQEIAAPSFAIPIDDGKVELLNVENRVARLIQDGQDDQKFGEILSIAEGYMDKAGLGRTLHNACAATLSALLIDAGFSIPVTLSAGVLAQKLRSAGWTRIGVGGQQPGDVGVAKANVHIFLVLEAEGDILIIADNQAPHKHYRAASGKAVPNKFRATTATDYFLRAPDVASVASLAEPVDGPSNDPRFPSADEDTSFVASVAA